MNTEEMNSVNFWNEIHKSSFCSRDAIICDDWLNRYADIINACNSPILDIIIEDLIQFNVSLDSLPLAG